MVSNFWHAVLLLFHNALVLWPEGIEKELKAYMISRSNKNYLYCYIVNYQTGTYHTSGSSLCSDTSSHTFQYPLSQLSYYFIKSFLLFIIELGCCFCKDVLNTLLITTIPI